MKRSVRKRVFATANSVLAAARAGGLDDAAFRQVGAAKAAGVIARVRGTFAGGEAPPAGGPLWTRLRGLELPAAEPHELSALLALGPPDTPVFLLVEDWERPKPGWPFWVFEATLAAAVATLDNHALLEFYLVARSFDWLVAENHHNVLIVAGDQAASALARAQGGGRAGRGASRPDAT